MILPYFKFRRNTHLESEPGKYDLFRPDLKKLTRVPRDARCPEHKAWEEFDRNGCFVLHFLDCAHGKTFEELYLELCRYQQQEHLEDSLPPRGEVALDLIAAITATLVTVEPADVEAQS